MRHKGTKMRSILRVRGPGRSFMFPEVLVPAGLVLAIDQTSKRLVLTRCGFGRLPASPLRPVINKTIVLGLITDRRAVVILWALAVLGTMLLVYCAPQFQAWQVRIGMGAALGGATSNLVDWLRRGGIVDFIDLRIWPVFNLADVFIVLGIGVVLCSIR